MPSGVVPCLVSYIKKEEEKEEKKEEKKDGGGGGVVKIPGDKA